MTPRAPTGDETSSARNRAGAPTRWVGSAWARLGTVLIIVGGAGIGVLLNGVPTLATAQAWVAGFGWWAPLVFVLLYAAATVSLLPMTVLSAFAGTLFGIPAGIAVVWCGAMLGSAVAFLLGGSGATGAPTAPAGTWRGFLQRHGTWAVAVTRLVPVIPLGLVNYAFALTPVRLGQYLLGTGIGIVPVTVVLVVLGDQVTSAQSPASVVAVTGAAVLVAGASVLVRRRRARAAASTSGEAGGPEVESR